MIHWQTHRSGIALLTAFVWLMVACESKEEAERKHCDSTINFTFAKNEDVNYYREILSMNKNIIPCLINLIDTKEKYPITFDNPMSSFIYSYMVDNQKGIKYAYLIELILTKDSIETINKTWDAEEDIIHWCEITLPYRIYGIGIIMKEDKEDKKDNSIFYPLTYNNPRFFDPLTHEGLIKLTHEDMIKIKEMYLEWWEANKEKPIETLRKEFREGNKILKEPYVWI